jgi:hypothetical protein
MGAAGVGGGGEDVERGQRVELETGDPRVVVERGEARSGGRRRVPVLVPILVVLAVLCAGAVVVGFLWYQRSTEVERKNPLEVLQQYLDARFNEPAPDRVKLFVCRDPDLTDLESVLDELGSRARSSDISIELNLTNSSVETNGNSSVVNSQLKISYIKGASVGREYQMWKFDLAQQDGWRLCRAHRA